MPVGTLRESIVEPALDCEEAEADEKKSRSGLRERFVERRSRAMIEEGIRDPRCGGKKRNENSEGDHEKYQVNDCGNGANPEAWVWQRRSDVNARASHFSQRSTILSNYSARQQTDTNDPTNVVMLFSAKRYYQQ